jgi:hypothetical protein
MLYPSLFTIHESFFDQPSAARFLLGMADFVNNFSKENARSVYFNFNSKTKNLKIAFNCNEQEVKLFSEMKVEEDEFEFGVSQNIFEFFYPFNITYDLGKAKKEDLFNPHKLSKLLDLVKSLGLNA